MHLLSCLDTDCFFIRMMLLGLRLLILCAVILTVVDSHAVVRHFLGWSQFSRYLAVEGCKFGFENSY